MRRREPHTPPLNPESRLRESSRAPGPPKGDVLAAPSLLGTATAAYGVFPLPQPPFSPGQLEGIFLKFQSVHATQQGLVRPARCSGCLAAKLKGHSLQVCKYQPHFSSGPVTHLLRPSPGFSWLNVNGLTIPIKRERLEEKIKKCNPITCCVQETHFKHNDINRLKVKEQIKSCHANVNKSRSGYIK